ncbi:MAG: hypothetical protein EA392_08875 [Cryomorphaceae bacterium]|nr:MAG: hypothetical protein EA392_08875 [Cryomorphaceae bacterium]
MKTNIVAFLLGAILITACGGSASEQEQAKNEMESLAHRIDSLEQVLFSHESRVDREAAAQLLQSYIKFVDTYPTDERAPHFLYKGAGIARGVGVHNRAIEMYFRILDDYPDFGKDPEIYFLIAFTLDNDVKDIEGAKGMYNEVIARFPDHEFAVQAEERLKTIDLTDEELIELFMQRNAEAEAGAAGS